MRSETTAFYDVDTQRDFILPDGRLHASGAEKIIPALRELTLLARRYGIKLLGSVDKHQPGDRELERNGGEYPDHCMAGTAGQRKIDATAPLKAWFVPNRNLSADERRAALEHRGEVIFEKQDFDVFVGNRSADRLLADLLRGYRDVVVYGVVTEICVDHAVRGLRKFGLKLHVVTDAIADIGEHGREFRAKWRKEGVDLITLARLKQRLSH
ncbi:MAG TPA: cysteine hydrolase family protein [Candidatus Binataceae bacterium]|nr:cysteine hydrolase family protein [Candidatus Binataceae bacterium]